MRGTSAHRRRGPALAAALAAATLLAGCTNHEAPPISAVDLAQARIFKEFTVYWAGNRIDGVPLTAADSPPISSTPRSGSRSTTATAWAAAASTRAAARCR